MPIDLLTRLTGVEYSIIPAKTLYHVVVCVNYLIATPKVIGQHGS